MAGEPHQQVADFGPRLVAWVLDGVFSNILGFIVGGILAIVLAIAVAASQDSPSSVREEDQQNDDVATAAIVGFYLGFLPVWFGYDWISNATGAGWGKRIMKMRIVKVGTSHAPGAGAGLGRSLVSLLSGILYIGYLWALWDKEKRTWHDHAAGTTVVLT